MPENMDTIDFMSHTSNFISDTLSEARQGKDLDPFKGDLGNRFPRATIDSSSDFVQVNPLAMSLESSHRVTITANDVDSDKDDYGSDDGPSMSQDMTK